MNFSSKIVGHVTGSLIVGVVALAMLSSLPASPLAHIGEMLPDLFPGFVHWAKGGLDESTFSFLAVSWVVGICLVAAAEVQQYRHRHMIEDDLDYLDTGKRRHNALGWLFKPVLFQIDVRKNYGERLAAAVKVHDAETAVWGQWTGDDYKKCFELSYFFVSRTAWVRAEFAKIGSIANVSFALAVVFAVGFMSYIANSIAVVATSGTIGFAVVLIIAGLASLFASRYCFGVHGYLRLRQVELILSRFMLETRYGRLTKRAPVKRGRSKSEVMTVGD